MYLQPYGDEQQLNLNWIINEIINLHKQLDPDYETPSFTQVYPYSNLNRLNLDWILSELKALKELAPEPAPTIDIQAVAEALVALPFDSNTPYQIYDFISRDGEIWRATQAIAAGGDWDETKWFKTKLGTDLAVLERWINAINNSLTSLQNTVDNLDSADIADDSDAGGATVKASLNKLKSAVDTLDSDIDNLTSADISDESDAGGATVKASLNNLKGSLNTLDSDVTALENSLAVQNGTPIPDVNFITSATIPTTYSCSKTGKIGYVDFVVQDAAVNLQTPSEGFYYFITVPAGYRPTNAKSIPCNFINQNSQQISKLAGIYPDGRLALYLKPSETGGSISQISATGLYIID